MIEKIQHATASSPEGAKGLVKGVLACAFQNMAFMLPTGLLYLLVKDLLAGSTSGRSTFYLLGCVACFALILLTTWFQYNGTYFTTYKESGTRRLTLAERLRKLPLSFFGKRDLADLTSTIMADCEVLEKDCSHFIPGLFGSLISTVLIALSLFAFEWRMALAALWVIPVSAAIVVGSYRVQDRIQARTMAVKMDCADGIQEYIETLRNLKASNAEQGYLSGLSKKIRAVEKQSVAAELETALFVSSASMVLKLGISSVALTGSVLLVNGSIDVLTLFLFLMAASRMYDPMQGALQNLAAVIAMRTNVGRMNEILEYPVQTGSETMTNQGCDIVFDHVGFAYNSGETVLKDVSFTAKQGEVTALVGPSGGGKTTVSRLAARFWDYQKGSITVGGMEVSQIDPEKLMSLYSIVFQNVTLFDNTILENVRLGRKGATDEEVLAAAKLANCEEFAEKLPDKWNTNIGENGCALSGGERQRISIARAFLKDEKQLKETELGITNMLNAIQMGILTSSTKERLEALEDQRKELQARIAEERLAKPKMKEEFVRFWLLRFRKLDMTQPEQRQALVDTFINAIYLYDDKVLITFNYKEGTETVAFGEAVKAEKSLDMSARGAPNFERQIVRFCVLSFI